MLILMLAVDDVDERIVQALCTDTGGELLENMTPARLIECLQGAVDGGGLASMDVAPRVAALLRQFRPAANPDYDLTPHETRLLKLMVEGHNYKSAASELRVTVHTISFHMRRIYAKLQVHSKSEAVAKALRSHLLV